MESLPLAGEGEQEGSPLLTSIHTLASGSSGNALVFSWQGGRLLLDAGISCRRITQSLRTLGMAREDLCAILITHTHSDHISGLQTLLKSTTCPVLASDAACRQLRYRLADIESRLVPLPLCAPFFLDGCTVVPVPTSHDAPGSCGYRLETADGVFALLTDTGYVTEEAEELLPGSDLILLEANHDVEALRSGPYPYYLKERILGPLGHLSNEAAARFAAELARRGASEIVLGHLSQENNTPAMAEAAVGRALAPFPSCTLSVAPRDTISRAYTLGAAKGCPSTADVVEPPRSSRGEPAWAENGVLCGG